MVLRKLNQIPFLSTQLRGFNTVLKGPLMILLVLCAFFAEVKWRHTVGVIRQVPDLVARPL